MADMGMGVIPILTDRGTEYCGKAETHDYQLYLAINDIEHTKTKVRHPQTNGICERLHRKVLDEFTKLRLERKFMKVWRICKMTLTCGFSFTIMSARIKAKSAVAERRWKPCWRVNKFGSTRLQV